MSYHSDRHLRTVALAQRIADRLERGGLSEARRAELERTLDQLAWQLSPSERDEAMECAA